MSQTNLTGDMSDQFKWNEALPNAWIRLWSSLDENKMKQTVWLLTYSKMIEKF
jgi:hypothetical protein